MTRPLSTDLRERLVSAVEGSQSRRSAAKVFGVSAETAIRWVDQWRRSGSVAALAQGGDNRSHRAEAYAEEIQALTDEAPEITLAEIASVDFKALQGEAGSRWHALVLTEVNAPRCGRRECNGHTCLS